MIWGILGILLLFTMWPLVMKLAAKKPTSWDDVDDPPPPK